MELTEIKVKTLKMEANWLLNILHFDIEIQEI